MRKLLGRDVAALFSLFGKKGKKNFSQTQLYKVVVGKSNIYFTLVYLQDAAYLNLTSLCI
jgi:hypothetical protein